MVRTGENRGDGPEKKQFSNRQVTLADLQSNLTLVK